MEIIRSQLNMLFTIFASSRTVHGSLSAKFDDAIPGMRNRSTTKAHDEALILGAIFNLDTKAIASLEGHHRMREFYAQLGRIPLQILFAGLPVLPIADHGWAPRTLDIDEGNIGLELVDVDRYGIYSSQGLSCNLPALILDKAQSKPRRSDRIFFEIGQRAGAKPAPNQGWESGKSAAEAQHCCLDGSTGVWWSSHESYNAIVLRDPLETTGYDYRAVALLANILRRSADQSFVADVLATTVLSFRTVNFTDSAEGTRGTPDSRAVYQGGVKILLK